jgi:hypothetical protein
MALLYARAFTPDKEILPLVVVVFSGRHYWLIFRGLQERVNPLLLGDNSCSKRNKSSSRLIDTVAGVQAAENQGTEIME